MPGTADMPANSSSSAHPDQPDQREDDSSQREDDSRGEGSERFVRGDGSGSEPNLGSLAEDVAHPFDQTNGILDQLEGDADDPERVEERLGDPKAFGDAFSGSAEDRAAVQIHDIGLHAVRNDEGEIGFRVLAGGGLGRL